MNVKKLYFLALVLLFSFCFVFFKKQNSVLEEKTLDSSFFAPIPIVKLSATDSPCIQVQIEDKVCFFDIDLGFQGDLSISSSLIDQISEKSFAGTRSTFSFTGEECTNKLYFFPEIKIGSLTVFKPRVHEANDEFYYKAVIVKDGGQPSPKEAGTLGWELFYNFNLLLDCKNSKIACCDSIETLKQQGFLIETYAKIPFSLERGVIEFSAKTENGPLRCILDTGCTFNILNRQIEGDVTEILFNDKHQISCPSLKVDELDFGPLVFRPLSIKSPAQIEALLGMEFIKQHTIFIDFKHKTIYISPNSDS
jgi:hypothetical protein